MKYVNCFLIIIILISCNQTRQDKNQNQTKVIFSSENDFLKFNNKNLRSNYFKLFNKVANEIEELEFSIIDSKIVHEGELIIFGLKISAVGKIDWSYSEKLIVVTNTNNIIFDSDFRQVEPELKITECGVPNYDLESINIKKIGNKKIILTEIREYFRPCGGQGGQPKTETKTLFIHSFDALEKIDSIETYYYFSNYDTKLFERNSLVTFNDDRISVEKTVMKENQKISKEDIVFKLENNKLVL